MKYPALLLSFALLSVSICAEDLQLTDGTVYREALIAKFGSSGARITHSDGVSVVKPELLPAEWQKRIGYDPARAAASAKAAAARAEEARAASVAQAEARAQAQASSVSLRGRVVQVLPQGLLVRCAPGFYLANFDQTDGADLPEISGEVLLRGHPDQMKFVDGAIVGVIALKADEPFRYGGSTLAAFSYFAQASSADPTVAGSISTAGQVTIRRAPQSGALQRVGGNVGR